MENWGAITYRDTMLLIDPDNSSALVKQRCAKTIAHELAHMWFGNLVTMEWVRAQQTRRTESAAGGREIGRQRPCAHLVLFFFCCWFFSGRLCG